MHLLLQRLLSSATVTKPQVSSFGRCHQINPTQAFDYQEGKMTMSVLFEVFEDEMKKDLARCEVM
jgi:hypothetical protein